jgi:archaellin
VTAIEAVVLVAGVAAIVLVNWWFFWADRTANAATRQGQSEVTAPEAGHDG